MDYVAMFVLCLFLTPITYVLCRDVVKAGNTKLWYFPIPLLYVWGFTWTWIFSNM
jgi:hypothetical protein